MEEELEFREFQIENGKRMKELLKDENFKVLFHELFVDAWQRTQIGNFASASHESRGKVNEGMLIRSGFLNYIDEVLSDANEALAIKEELLELEKQEQEENE